MKRSERAFLMTSAFVSALMLLTPLAFSTEFEVEMDNFVFVPHGTRINVGDMITWRNRDAAQHSATSDNGVWDSGLLSFGQSYSFVFTTPGAFPYHCSLHLSMKDTIFVSSPTGIGEDTPAMPGNFEVLQNYPNPFNARTTIQFNLSSPGHVTLTVYNMLGQRITGILDQDLKAGYQQVTWDAGSAPSGIYFFQVKAGNLSQTRRMLLLK